MLPSQRLQELVFDECKLLPSGGRATEGFLARGGGEGVIEGGAHFFDIKITGVEGQRPANPLHLRQNL